MKRRSHAKRRDRNEPAIVDALRRLGCTVYLLDGPADLLVASRGEWALVEVKDGDKPPSARPLTPAEEAFFARRLPGCHVVRCVEEALCVLDLKSCRHEPGDSQWACGCGGVDDPSWFTALREAAIAAARKPRRRKAA